MMIRYLISRLCLALHTGGEERRLDPQTGMFVAECWEMVCAHCTECHSAQQFTRQQGTRRSWQEMIRWMQRYHGLWTIEAKNRDANPRRSGETPQTKGRLVTGAGILRFLAVESVSERD